MNCTEHQLEYNNNTDMKCIEYQLQYNNNTYEMYRTPAVVQQ
jgi:hypothetical protein